MPDKTAILDELFKVAEPVAHAFADGHLTVDNAWTDPSITAVRDTLTALLTKDGTVDRLLQASHDMRVEHNKLLKKQPFTAADLQQLGILSAGAALLSAEAFATA